MQLATVLTPESDDNLQLAAQCGVTDIVTRYHPTRNELANAKRRFASFGLRLSVIEGYLPMENLKIGRDDGSELQAMKDLVRQMGRFGDPCALLQLHGGH